MATVWVIIASVARGCYVTGFQTSFYMFTFLYFRLLPCRMYVILKFISKPDKVDDCLLFLWIQGSLLSLMLGLEFSKVHHENFKVQNCTCMFIFLNLFWPRGSYCGPRKCSSCLNFSLSFFVILFYFLYTYVNGS